LTLIKPDSEIECHIKYYFYKVENYYFRTCNLSESIMQITKPIFVLK